MKLHPVVPPYQNTSGRKRLLENDPNVTWRFFERYLPIFNQEKKKCWLCLREQFNIVLNRDKKYLYTAGTFIQIK